MAGTLGGSSSLTPQPSKVATTLNYLKTSDFQFLNQYLPDTVKEEYEIYGDRSLASFMRLVGAEVPSTSDLIKWSEEGRLHTKYTGLTFGAIDTPVAGQQVFTNASDVNFRVNQTVFLSSEQESTESAKGVIVAVSGATFTVAYYAATGGTSPFSVATTGVTAFVYGSEFRKGTVGMEGSLEAETTIREVKPIIIKDNYTVSGSDMAQISWIEVEGLNGQDGYLWYLKSSHETRMRFDDYLEMSMVEAEEAESGSGAATYLGSGGSGEAGTQGFFDAVRDGGNIWTGSPDTLADYDTILERLDGEGAIRENVLFVNRGMSLDTDDMLGGVNGHYSGGTSFGMFDNDEDMALNLGFSGFRRGTYDFYKTDWKYLNDATTRGGITGGAVNGVLVPAGEKSVYDQVLGQNMKRPFLHCRYRASETENRKYKVWVTGGAGDAQTDDIDAMNVNFLSERALCTVGRNNFMIFQD